jgi:hypothetical protein
MVEAVVLMAMSLVVPSLVVVVPIRDMGHTVVVEVMAVVDRCLQGRSAGKGALNRKLARSSLFRW